MLEQLAARTLSIEDAMSEGVEIQGNIDAVRQWLALHETFDMWFNIVTP